LGKNHLDSLIKKKKIQKIIFIPLIDEFSQRKFDSSASIDQMLNKQKNSCHKNPNCPTNSTTWNAKYEVEKKMKK
jgi:hypothetical protein